MGFSSIRNRLSRSPLGRLYRLRHRLRTTRDIFTEVYRRRIWNSTESVSGTGSTLEQTETLREMLPQLLEELNVHTMLDAPCGDFHWMKEAHLNLEQYIGVDIVEEIIAENNRSYKRPGREFFVRNIIEDSLPTVDLIFSRDVLIHLRDHEIFRALANFKRSGSKYLLTTTFPGRINEDLEFTGMFRPLDLQAAPFNFPPPLRLLSENCTECEGAFADKSLGLWLLSSL